MVVGVLRMRLYMRGNRSLKDKRQILLKIKDKVSHHFNVSIAEVADNDDWKSAVIGITTAGNDAAFVQSVLHKATQTIEGLCLAETLAKDTIVRTYPDGEFQKEFIER